MEKLIVFIVGISFGALSWGLAYAVSGKFEPFDSHAGFLVTQVILSSAALIFGFKMGVFGSTVLVFGGYVGLNAYAYTFGGSEARAWALLGVVTTIALVLFPALSGLLGGIASGLLSRFRQWKAKQG